MLKKVIYICCIFTIAQIQEKIKCGQKNLIIIRKGKNED
nr:MAG TPA: hypothetical protein [Bacteriophage sp.]